MGGAEMGSIQQADATNEGQARCPAAGGSEAGASAAAGAHGMLCIEPVYLLEFSRTPRSFFAALEGDPKLQRCQLALQDTGLATTLPSGSRLFVTADQHGLVQSAIHGWTHLRSRHLIAQERFVASITDAVGAIPGHEQVHEKGAQRRPVPLEPHAEDLGSELPESPVVQVLDEGAKRRPVPLEDLGDELPESPVWLVQKTFIHIPLPSSLVGSDCGSGKFPATV